MRLFLRMGGWFVPALAALITALSLWADSRERLAARFEGEARSTQARVVEKIDQAQPRVDGSVAHTYFVDLLFATPAGQSVVVRRRVDAERFTRLDHGGKVALSYLPDAPARVSLANRSRPGNEQGLQRAALGLGGLALWLLWRIGGRAVSGVRARREGQPCLARLTAVRLSRMPGPGGTQARIVWRDGDGVEGRSLPRAHSALRGLCPGQSVTVYRHADRTWWAGDVGKRPSR